MADSFRGGVGDGDAERAIARARVAIHGLNVEALTGDKTFRIPIARCLLERVGRKIVVRDGQGALVIWSDEERFLDALERAQRGTLADQVRRLRDEARRRRLVRWCGYALIAAGAAGVASAPVTRWAVGGGVASIENGIGEAALERLALPPGQAPTTEKALGGIAELLRPAATPSIRSFRLLLADYAEMHSFGVPPSTVVVTAGLVCAADGPDLVMAAVARELAHLEGHHVSQRVAEAVEWRTAFDLARGDASSLRGRMLDFADARRHPGFTPEQEAAADQRATAMLVRVSLAPNGVQDLAAMTARKKDHPPEAAKAGLDVPAAARRIAIEEVGRVLGIQGVSEWSKVRAEACDVIGR